MNAHAYALIQTHGVKAVTKARIEREGGREIERGREGGSARGRRICCISCMSRQNDRCSSSLMSNGTLVYKYNIQRLHSQHKPQRPPLLLLGCVGGGGGGVGGGGGGGDGRVRDDRICVHCARRFGETRGKMCAGTLGTLGCCFCVGP